MILCPQVSKTLSKSFNNPECPGLPFPEWIIVWLNKRSEQNKNELKFDFIFSMVTSDSSLEPQLPWMPDLIELRDKMKDVSLKTVFCAYACKSGY